MGNRTHRPLFRTKAVACITSLPFIYNNSFKTVSGGEWFVNGNLQFPEVAPRKKDGTYRSHFGPCVSHNGLIYEDSDRNVALALRRLTCVRKPEHRGLHELLTALQRRFVIEHRGLLLSMRDRYTRFFADYDGHYLEAQEHHGDDHPKKALRIAAWNDIHQNGMVHRRLWLENTTYKMKKDEIAKPGKYPRMIGDLGVSASLQGFVVTKLLKNAQESEALEFAGGVIEFCARPDPASLEKVFAKLICPPGRFYFVYFSDDACLSIRRSDGRIDRYNLDISSCDASHGSYIFKALQLISPRLARKDIDILIDQCRTPILLRSKGCLKRVVKLVPHQPRLYSGSTLTTTINNLANLLIGVSIAESDYTGPASISLAARRVGYLLTTESCEMIQDLQFLKHSPVISISGAWKPCLNLGVLLRASGTCRGDLPGRGDLVYRARVFQSALLRGLYPRTAFPLISRMKRACPAPLTTKLLRKCQVIVEKKLQYRVHDSGSWVFFSSEELYKRYRLTPLEVGELDTMFGDSPVGTHFASSGCSKVLATDYGLDICTRSPRLY